MATSASTSVGVEEPIPKSGKLLDRGSKVGNKGKEGAKSPGSGTPASSEADEGSADDDDEDLSDFTELAYKLRKKLLPPFLDPEEASNMSVDKKAKVLQKKLDDQIDKLKKSKRMKMFLEREVKDEVPCPMEHVVHFRRVLDILIAELRLPIRLQERTRGSCVAFKIVNVPANSLPNTPSQGRSQLPFSQGMLEIPKMTAEGYCPFVDKMAGRFNRVSSDVPARNLRKKLKEYGLERMLQQSKGGPLHAFSSFISAYGMLSPVDGKAKAIYLVYGDEIGRRAGHPEYMTPTALTRIIHKDSSHSGTIDDILKNMMIEAEPRNQKDKELRLSTFSNFLEAEGVKLVYDFGRVLDHVSKPTCGKEAKTVFQALTMFEHYYEMNESFDHYTHGMGAGLVGMVVHAVMDFLGPLVNQQIDHAVTGPERGTPVSVYVSKLKEIVNSVVTDATEESSGRLMKVEEVKEKAKEKEPATSKGKSRVRTKQTERKTPEDSDPEEEEIVSVCSDDEKEFTTLTGVDGKEYHPPSRRKTVSKYSHKDAGGDISKNFDAIRFLVEQQQVRIDKQQEKISRLTRENETARNKLKQISGPPQPKKKKSSVTKQTGLKGFVSTQMLEGLVSDKDSDSNGDDDIEEVPPTDKPDSTQPVFHFDVHQSDAGSSVVIPLTQEPRKRNRIDSGSTAVDVVESQHEEADDDSEVVSELKRKKDQLEEKCREMEQQLLGQRMENAFRHFQQQITKEIRNLRSALIGAFGRDVETDERVVEALAGLNRSCCTKQYMGYTIRCGTDFVDRVYKSLLAGQVPEQQMDSSKTDNSVDDPILGYTIDVVYELYMPVIVKSEKFEHEDDDLQFLGLIPAPHPVVNTSVKQEKTEYEEKQVENKEAENNKVENKEAENNEAKHSEDEVGLSQQSQQSAWSTQKRSAAAMEEEHAPGEGVGKVPKKKKKLAANAAVAPERSLRPRGPKPK